MAIRELSHERRNIMLPRYPRLLGRHQTAYNVGSALNAVAWAILPGVAALWQEVVTVYQDETLLFKVHLSVERVGVASDETIAIRLRDTTNAINIAHGTANAQDVGFASGNASHAGADILAYATQNAAAGAITYEIQYITSAASKWQLFYGAFQTEIVRD